MPRKPRMYVADMPCHVIQRGNNRQACFFTTDDYRRYLAFLKDACRRYRVAVHAYVLMTNHARLLMTPQTPEGIRDQLGPGIDLIAEGYTGVPSGHIGDGSAERAAAGESLPDPAISPRAGDQDPFAFEGATQLLIETEASETTKTAPKFNVPSNASIELTVMLVVAWTTGSGIDPWMAAWTRPGVQVMAMRFAALSSTSLP